jgi:hypothetical protein
LLETPGPDSVREFGAESSAHPPRSAAEFPGVRGGRSGSMKRQPSPQQTWAVGECRPSRGRYGVDGQRRDGAKRSKPAAGPTHLPHKRLTGAYVAEIVSVKELLRFVHCHGQGGTAVERVAARQLALIPVAQLHEPVGAADTSTPNSPITRMG